MGTYLNATDLLKILLKWKKHLFIIGLATILISTIFSGPTFIEPKYKSFAILYPSNIIPYAGENQSEQMIQLLESDDIRRDVCRIFNLMKHYGIDSANDKYSQSHFLEMYKDNINFRKTEYESVEITVLDKDAKMASDIADSIIDLMNKKAKSLQREKSQEVVEIYKNQLDKKRAERDTMEKELRDIRTNYGITSYDNQSREVTREYLQALSMSGNAEGINEAKRLMKNLEEKGGDYVALNENLWRVRGSYYDIQTLYENAVKDVDKVLTYSNVVSKPFPADKKSYPVRWIIVLISTISTLFLAFMFLAFVEQRAKTKV
jgi:capsule polysaccharide export protein KpsE/RkpR